LLISAAILTSFSFVLFLLPESLYHSLPEEILPCQQRCSLNVSIVGMIDYWAVQSEVYARAFLSMCLCIPTHVSRV